MKRVILICLILLMPTLALGADCVYMYSDEGDLPLYYALSNQTEVVLSKEPEGDIILALDLNYPYLSEKQKKNLGKLVELAEKGRTVILGLNTLRAILTENATILESHGIYVSFDKRGIIYIKPNDALKFTSFYYDSDTYDIAFFKILTESKVILESDGIPIIVEIPVGDGKLILVAINLSASYFNTKDQHIVEFVASLINYINSGIPMEVMVLGALASVGIINSLVNSNKHIEKLKTTLKGIPIILFRFQKSANEILKNELRKGIYEYIKAKGYTTVNDVADTFGISRTNSKWHLSLLKRAGLIAEIEIGNTAIFYLPTKKEQAIIGFLLENKTRREIYNLLMNKPLGVSEIARILGISKSTAHYNLLILEKFGLIKRLENGRFEVSENAKVSHTS